MSQAQKTPLSRTLSIFAQQKARDEIAKLGQALPGHVIAVSGAIVTVAFDVAGMTIPQVTMPLFGPEYIRYPVQVGDKGVAFPASVYIGGVSGLGGGTANGTVQANLSTLVWFAIANKKWSPVDPLAVTIYGPNGVVLRDEASATVATLTPAGFNVTAHTSISLSAGGHTILISAAGITIDGHLFALHTHAGVTAGTGVTGPVVP
jgi:hypothetical protein